MSEKPQNVTPENSFVTIYLDPRPGVPLGDAPNPEETMKRTEKSRASAAAKLAALGLTEEEIAALIGGQNGS